MPSVSRAEHIEGIDFIRLVRCALQRQETDLWSVPVRDHQLVAGLDFGECGSSRLDIGALSLRSHRLAAAQKRVSSEGDDDPHG